MPGQYSTGGKTRLGHIRQPWPTNERGPGVRLSSGPEHSNARNQAGYSDAVLPSFIPNAAVAATGKSLRSGFAARCAQRSCKLNALVNNGLLGGAFAIALVENWNCTRLSLITSDVMAQEAFDHRVHLLRHLELAEVAPANGPTIDDSRQPLRH